MRKLVVSEFLSLEGVMQAPSGADEDIEGGFEHGGWTMPSWHDDIGNPFGALMQDVDAFHDLQVEEGDAVSQRCGRPAATSATAAPADRLRERVARPSPRL